MVVSVVVVVFVVVVAGSLIYPMFGPFMISSVSDKPRRTRRTYLENGTCLATTIGSQTAIVFVDWNGFVRTDDDQHIVGPSRIDL